MLIDATVRTNRYQWKPTLSFKLDPATIPDLPRPRPMFEIFVCSPRVEGVHLRAGPIARGGIRWSDRREDFRTEVLGLVKAQMVKNAVIVPVGAKGGFVVKNASADPAEQRLQGEECYREFVRGMLDLTDNVVGGVVAASARHGASTTATTRISSSPPTRAPPRSATSPTPSPPSTASGSATRSRPVGAPATTTRRWASRPAARGRACAATHACSARTPTRTRSPRSASATCRATCSATACCVRRTSGWSPPSTTATSSSTPIPIPRRRSPSASACSSSHARRGPTTTRG